MPTRSLTHSPFHKYARFFLCIRHGFGRFSIQLNLRIWTIAPTLLASFVDRYCELRLPMFWINHLNGLCRITVSNCACFLFKHNNAQCHYFITYLTNRLFFHYFELSNTYFRFLLYLIPTHKLLWYYVNILRAIKYDFYITFTTAQSHYQSQTLSLSDNI